MKTIREWIEICKKAQPEIANEWETNWNTSNAIRGSIALALKSSFAWYSSSRGRSYWETIHNDMHRNPDKYSIPKRKLFNKA
jgi:hypothetical protein